MAEAKKKGESAEEKAERLSKVDRLRKQLEAAEAEEKRKQEAKITAVRAQRETAIEQRDKINERIAALDKRLEELGVETVAVNAAVEAVVTDGIEQAEGQGA